MAKLERNGLAKIERKIQLGSVCDHVVTYLSSNIKDISALKNLIIFPTLSVHADYEDRLLKNILDNFNFKLPDNIILEILNVSRTSFGLNDACNALVKFRNSTSGFSTTDVVELHRLLSPDHYFNFINLSDNDKHKLTKIMLDVFNKSEMLQFHSGFQSPFDKCADFVNRELWDWMNDSSWIEFLKDLLKIHQDDIWTNRIKHKIYELSASIGIDPQVSSIQRAKDFIFNTGYTNPKEFWIDVCDKLIEIKQVVETSESNRVNVFYNTDSQSPKKENECRDVLFNTWNDRCCGAIEAFTSREYYVNDDKRVDFTLKCKRNEDYHVHVECKRDNNSKIDKGIAEQLIPLYLKDNPNNYGVYFVFCFEDDPAVLKCKLIATIPPDYANRIEVICLDLRKEKPRIA